MPCVSAYVCTYDRKKSLGFIALDPHSCVPCNNTSKAEKQGSKQGRSKTTRNARNTTKLRSPRSHKIVRFVFPYTLHISLLTVRWVCQSKINQQRPRLLYSSQYFQNTTRPFYCTYPEAHAAPLLPWPGSRLFPGDAVVLVPEVHHPRLENAKPSWGGASASQGWSHNRGIRPPQEFLLQATVHTYASTVISTIPSIVFSTAVLFMLPYPILHRITSPTGTPENIYQTPGLGNP